MKRKDNHDKTMADAALLRQYPRLKELLRHFRISQLLALSFAAVILTGSILLSLPAANASVPAPYLNNLFVATSAVCVTGLTPVVVAEQYSLFGKIVMIVLMQIGGLGLMTFVALFLMMRRQQLSFSEQTVFAAASGKSGMFDVPGYLRRILKYTCFFELCGFLLLSIRMVQDFGLASGLFHALFLTVSAFTNSGFDAFAPDSLVRYVRDPLVSLTIMMLITVGGLGFMVWMDVSQNLKHCRSTERYRLHDFWSHLMVHSRIVIKASAILFASATLLILAMEYRNPDTLGSLPFWSKVLAASFQSVTLRTAGFATLRLGTCYRATLLIMCVYMLIGGSPGGTAGGMKTTTAAVLLSTVWAAIHGGRTGKLCRRQVQMTDVLRALVICSLYLGFLLLGMILLLMTDGTRSTMIELLFEASSAIGTVGLTAGITPGLSMAGKIIIILLMYIGRVGPLAIVEVFQRRHENGHSGGIDYPPADIMIG